jgi:hypothetical protein
MTMRRGSVSVLVELVEADSVPPDDAGVCPVWLGVFAEEGGD